MSRMEDDPTGGGDGGDWWSQNAPPAASGSQSRADFVAQLYRSALGREASSAEVAQWANGPLGIAEMQQAIYASPEAQAWGARNANPTPPPPPPKPPGTDETKNPTTNGGTTLGVPTSGFGAPPPDYHSDPNAPQYQPMADYVPPTWTGGDFQNPTLDDLENSPGYRARLDRLITGRERASAAQGTILNGGTLKALDRAGQEYATGEYQTLRSNALENYRQRYSQFQDAAGMSLAARTANANENQNTFLNRTNTYTSGNTRTLSDFITNLNKTRNSELDYWNRLKDVSGTGADLAGASR